jgi:hypothetical protein
MRSHSTCRLDCASDCPGAERGCSGCAHGLWEPGAGVHKLTSSQVHKFTSLETIAGAHTSAVSYYFTGRFRSCTESSNHGQLANSPALRRPWRTAHLETQNPPWKAGRCPAKPGKVTDVAVVIFPENLNRRKLNFEQRFRFAQNRSAFRQLEA